MRVYFAEARTLGGQVVIVPLHVIDSGEGVRVVAARDHHPEPVPIMPRGDGIEHDIFKRPERVG